MVILYISLNNQNVESSKKSAKDFGKDIQAVVLKGIDKINVTHMDTHEMKNLLSESLDNMFKLNDDIMKQEMEIENYLKVVEKRIIELDEVEKGKKTELKITTTTEMEPLEAVRHFKWLEQKYPRKGKTIQEVIDKLYKKFTESQKQLKNKNDEYQNALNNYKIKEKGEVDARSLMKHDYRDFIDPALLPETDYLVPVLCFVPLGSEKFFLERHESLADGFVLPSSALRLGGGSEDGVYLYRVLVMKHMLDKFKSDCQGTLRVPCRDFDAEAFSRRGKEKADLAKMSNEIKAMRKKLVVLSKSAYSEMFVALLHIKMLRIYIESNLKYSSTDCYTYIVETPRDKQTKVISLLIKQFSDTNEQGLYGLKEETKDSEDFFPFILLRLTVPVDLDK